MKLQQGVKLIRMFFQPASRNWSSFKVFIILAAFLFLNGCRSFPHVCKNQGQPSACHGQNSGASVLSCIGILSCIHDRIPCKQMVLAENGRREIKEIALRYPDELAYYRFKMKNVIDLKEDSYRELLNGYMRYPISLVGRLSLSKHKTILHLRLPRRELIIASDVLRRYGLTDTRYRLSDLSDPLFAELSQIPLKLSQKELEDLPSAVVQINKKLKQCGISDWRIRVDNSGRFESMPVKGAEEGADDDSQNRDFELIKRK